MVDEALVERTMQEIKKNNPAFFDELKARKVAEHQLLFAFYTQSELTDFDSKQAAKEKLATLITRIPTDETNFRHSLVLFSRPTC